MTEIDLGYIEAYFHDRVKELKNQLPNGDPFVFIGALSVLATLSRASNKTMLELLPKKYDKLDKDDFNTLGHAHIGLTTAYSLVNCRVSITHENKLHLRKDGSRTALAAEPFIKDIDIAISQLFSDASVDPILGARLFVNFNETPVVG